MNKKRCTRNKIKQEASKRNKNGKEMKYMEGKMKKKSGTWRKNEKRNEKMYKEKKENIK